MSGLFKNQSEYVLIDREDIYYSTQSYLVAVLASMINGSLCEIFYQKMLEDGLDMGESEGIIAEAINEVTNSNSRSKTIRASEVYNEQK